MYLVWGYKGKGGHILTSLRDNYLVNRIRKCYYSLKNWDKTLDRIKTANTIKRYHNTHSGDRCVVIGNGPSLKVDDLEKISSLSISSFACNRIYKIFPQTKWRPSYYFMSDKLLLDDSVSDLDEIPFDRRFFPESFREIIKQGVFYYPGPEYYDYEKEAKFSFDASKGVYGGGTVTYEMIQFAYYMGFSKIYLIGVDFNYIIDNPLNDRTYSYNGENNYFIKDYLKPGEVAAMPNVNANLLAYQAAKEASKQKGFIIRNATRGGKLEVFERIDLDELLYDWNSRKV